MKKNYKNNKKRNAAYWDEIDAVIEQTISEISEFSDEELEEDALEDVIGDGIIADVRELIINYLAEKGGKFPFVNEDM